MELSEYLAVNFLYFLWHCRRQDFDIGIAVLVVGVGRRAGVELGPGNDESARVERIALLKGFGGIKYVLCSAQAGIVPRAEVDIDEDILKQVVVLFQEFA